MPQGTLIERVRAGGYGLGGILTPTGVGTVVEEGKRKIDGRRARTICSRRRCARDFALVQAFLADYLGNLSLCADGAQLQSDDGDGGRHGDRRRRSTSYRSA